MSITPDSSIARQYEDGTDHAKEVADHLIDAVISTPQARPGPKVTFCFGLGDHFAKIFLPKTYEEAKLAARMCFPDYMKYTNHSKSGMLRDFELRVSIRRNDGRQAWAHIRPHEWWEMMNQLIDENPYLEVGVFLDAK